MTAGSTPQQDKQITIDVAEDRVAEFYAFYAHFLAGSPGRHGRGRGRPGHRGHRCGPHHHHHVQPADASTETATA